MEREEGGVTITEILKTVDGRRRMPPMKMLPRRRGSPLTVAQVRRAVERFQLTGKSDHSANGTLLPYIVAYCEEMEIQYALLAGSVDGGRSGYFVTRVTDEEARTIYRGGAA